MTDAGWTLDAKKDEFFASPVLDASTGLGGSRYYLDSSNLTAPVLHVPGTTGGDMPHALHLSCEEIAS